MVQRMNANNNNKCVAQLAEYVLFMVPYVGGQSGRVDVVFDIYRQQPSIKDSERLNRGVSTALQYKCLTLVDTTYTSGENS